MSIRKLIRALRMLMRSAAALLSVSLVLAPAGVYVTNSPAAISAKDAPAAANAVMASEKESPWLILPILSLNPKLGTSPGALGAYLH